MKIFTNSMSLAMDVNRHIGLVGPAENAEHGNPHTATRDCFDLLSVLCLVLNLIKTPAQRTS
jgi:hypothetical protein